MRTLGRRPSHPTIASIILTAVLGSAWCPPLARETESGSMSGTVTAVDTEARRIDVLTGVGHALSLVLFHVADDCRIVVGRAEVPLGDVKRGAVVEVYYRIGTGRREALVIRTLPAGEETS